MKWGSKDSAGTRIECAWLQFDAPAFDVVSKHMKLHVIVGVGLILLGAGTLGYRQFTYKTREKVLEIGTVSATAEVTKTVDLPPLLGWAALVSGVLIVVLPHVSPRR